MVCHSICCIRCRERLVNTLKEAQAGLSRHVLHLTERTGFPAGDALPTWTIEGRPAVLCKRVFLRHRSEARLWRGAALIQHTPTEAAKLAQKCIRVNGLGADPGTQARIACSSGPTPVIAITRFMVWCPARSSSPPAAGSGRTENPELLQLRYFVWSPRPAARDGAGCSRWPAGSPARQSRSTAASFL